MSPDQHARALRLADVLDSFYQREVLETASFLRELAAEPVRVPMTDEKFEEFIEQFRWYDGDVDRYDIQGFARELLRAHGITGDAK